MGLITKSFTFSAGATIIASEHNTNFDTIYNEFNGSITNANIASNAAIASTKLNLASIDQNITFTGTITMSGKQFLFAKGADVASASSITLGTDGNFFVITGTTNIQTITAKQAGSVVWLQFSGSGLTLVDDTGNLELRGHDIPVVAEDIVCLVSDGTDWEFVGKTGNLDRLLIPEISSAPATGTNVGALYTKNATSSSQTELFFRTESSGTEIQISNNGTVIATSAQIFTSSGTFTAPAGVTKVYITMVGGGGGGGGSSSSGGGDASGGGGSGGGFVVNRPMTVTPGNGYTVTIGAAGTAGAVDTDGGNGGTSSFDTLTVSGGLKGNKGTGASTHGSGGAAVGGHNASGGTGGGFQYTSGSGANGTANQGGGGGGTLLGSGGNGGASVAGTAATANSGAGGGGGGNDGSGGKAGGAGGSGVCIVIF